MVDLSAKLAWHSKISRDSTIQLAHTLPEGILLRNRKNKEGMSLPPATPVAGAGGEEVEVHK